MEEKKKKEKRLTYETTKNLLVLVSGGRSSAFMARHIQTSKKYKHFNKLYVFCNTGHEREETVDFLKNITAVWGIPLHVIEGVYSQVMGIGVKSKKVCLDSMDMEGKVFSKAIAHLNKNKWTGVPNPATPYCSDYLKTRVSHHYAKRYFGTTKYIKALGYRKEDIPRRVTIGEIEQDPKRIAPLLTDFKNPISLLDLDDFFLSELFRLTIDSRLGNCELCWKKSKKNLVESIQYGTRMIDWHREQEKKYGNMFFRENLSIDDLVKLAKADENFDETEDIEDSCVCNF